MNKAIITIPENGNKAEVSTNGVNTIVIINTLNALVKILSQQLVKEAQKAVGDNPKAQGKYLDKLCKDAGDIQDGITGSNIQNLN